MVDLRDDATSSANQPKLSRTLTVFYYPDGRNHLPGASAVILWSDKHQEVLESSKIALERYTPRASEIQKWWLSTPEGDDSSSPAEISPSAFAAVVQEEKVKVFLCGGLLSPDIILYPIGCNLSSESRYSFSIVAIGGPSVGKTMLLQRFSKGHAVQANLSPTIGTLTYHVERFLAIPGGEKVSLALQDTGGQERFSSLAPSIFRNVSGVFLVFDLTKQDTLTKCKTWLSTARKHIDDTIPVLLIGNKSDQTDERQIGYEKMEAFMSEHNVFDAMETSCTTGSNVEAAYQKLMQEIFTRLKDNNTLSEHLTTPKTPKKDGIRLESGETEAPVQRAWCNPRRYC